MKRTPDSPVAKPIEMVVGGLQESLVLKPIERLIVSLIASLIAEPALPFRRRRRSRGR